MPLTPPDWLTRHDGNLRPHYDGASWIVCFAGEPQYLLTPVPVAGKDGCRITQTINCHPLDSKGVYPTADEALRGGLEDLRKVLGW
jgi:hypothetical protein